ncbi:MAG: polyprenyl synthetase family protein [Anaerolineales bacterium]|nr:polyprenyl synthetase family protein [Anaerolineales bacterium]
MPLETYRNEMLPAVEEALKAAIQPANTPGQEVLYGMLAYHMGWEGPGAGPKAAGKRVRSILLLLSCAAAGGDWRAALPAAAAVELLHNFSLIHDDIQDKGELRRGRPTLWTMHGPEQAINAGDAMFSLAHISLEGLEQTAGLAVYAAAAKLLARTSLQLTQGQYLDMAYETVPNPGVEAYWPMIWGKTAVLIRGCTDLGARVAGLTGASLKAYMLFGEKLGLAYQVHDDLLGIWGNPDEMGKSAHTDLLSGKKSLPVLYALEKKGIFAERWQDGGIPEEQVAEFAEILEEEGARDFTRQQAAQLTQEALDALAHAQPQADAGAALAALAEELGHRNV